MVNWLFTQRQKGVIYTHKIAGICSPLSFYFATLELDAVLMQPSTFHHVALHSTNIHTLEQALKRNAPSQKDVTQITVTNTQRIEKVTLALFQPLFHSCFVEKYRMRAVQWENNFNTFLQTLVNISRFFGFSINLGVSWWYLVVTQLILVMVIGGLSSTLKFYNKMLLFFVTKERFNISLSNRICLLIIVLHCMNAPWIVADLLLSWCLKEGDYC